MSEESIPIYSRNKPNKNEQRALGGWFSVFDPDPSEYRFIQTEVPLGVQRAAEAYGRSIETDCSLGDLSSSNWYGDGFRSGKQYAQKFGLSIQQYTSNVDVVMVRQDGVDLVEIKTANQRIEGVGDLYEAFGQVLMYLDRFEEDYPTIAEGFELRGFILAEDSKLDVELVRPSLESRGIGYFDPVRGGFLVEPDNVFKFRDPSFA